jgi:hypothetical protein
MPMEGSRHDLFGVIAGLVPAIPSHRLRRCNVVTKATPGFIFLGNKPRLPSSWPMLNILLALDRLIGGIVNLKMHQAIYLIALRKTIDHLTFVLIYAADEIARDADIERAAGAACKNVYIELSHAPSVQNRDGRDKPGHDDA